MDAESLVRGYPPKVAVQLYALVTVTSVAGMVALVWPLGVAELIPAYVLTALLASAGVLLTRWTSATVGASLVALGVTVATAWPGHVLEAGLGWAGWMGMPFVATAIVRNLREATPWALGGAVGSLLLGAEAAQVPHPAEYVATMLYFLVLWGAVALFLRAKSRASRRLAESLARVQAEVEDRRLAEARAREAEQAQARFLATMSHEIRTPLHGIIGVANLLAREDLGQEHQPLVDTLQHSGDLLLSLLNDALDLSKIDAGELTLEPRPIAVVPLLERLVAVYRGAVAGREVVLQLDVDRSVPAGVRLDPSRLSQIVGNLLGNAAKFTRHGRISLLAAWQEDVLHLTVTDTGTGIAPERLEGLFDRFSQGADEGTQRGTGLGLALVKELSESMGGGVAVESEPGRGSTFRVTVAAPTCAVAQTSAERHGMDGLRLLLIDDNSVNRLVGKRLLESRGARVEVAEDAAAALELLDEQVFDAALVDVHMPGVDGLELARRIRALTGAAAALPLIALSAGGGGERQDALGAGMNAFQSKPMDLDSMAMVLKDVVRQPGDARASA